jgi:hypothetical protein
MDSVTMRGPLNVPLTALPKAAQRKELIVANPVTDDQQARSGEPGEICASCMDNCERHVYFHVLFVAWDFVD